jgi:hypothetical protein
VPLPVTANIAARPAVTVVSLGFVVDAGVQPESETMLENIESVVQPFAFVILHLKYDPVSPAVTVNPYVEVAALRPAA